MYEYLFLYFAVYLFSYLFTPYLFSYVSFVYLTMEFFMYYAFIYVFICVLRSICLFTDLLICLLIYLFTDLPSIRFSVFLFFYLSKE